MTRRPGRDAVAGMVIGAAVWSATEYAVHRWVMHGRRGANPFSEEHLDHHARPYRTFELAFDRNLAWKAAGVPVVGLPVAAAGGPVCGLAAGLAFSAGYAGYTHTHHVIHHRGPRGPLSRWLRKHHLAHHFSTPKRNFGVTNGWWDVLARTARTPAVLTVPRRLAPVWLVDEHGEVRPELAADYRLAGRTRRPVDDADVARALADAVPITD